MPHCERLNLFSLKIVALNKTKERMRPYHVYHTNDDPDIKKIKKVKIVFHIQCFTLPLMHACTDVNTFVGTLAQYSDQKRKKKTQFCLISSRNFGACQHVFWQIPACPFSPSMNGILIQNVIDGVISKFVPWPWNLALMVMDGFFVSLSTIPTACLVNMELHLPMRPCFG